MGINKGEPQSAMAWLLFTICTLCSFPWCTTHFQSIFLSFPTLPELKLLHPMLYSLEAWLQPALLNQSLGSLGKHLAPVYCKNFQSSLVLLYFGQKLSWFCVTRRRWGHALRRLEAYACWSQCNFAILKRKTGPLHPASLTIGIEEIHFFTLHRGQKNCRSKRRYYMNGIFDQ